MSCFTRETLGLCARGRIDGIPFVKEPVLVFHAKTEKLQISTNYYPELVFYIVLVMKIELAEIFP